MKGGAIDKAVGIVLLAAFVAGMVGYGGGKTNSAPQNLNMPLAPLEEVHPLVGLARSIWPEAFERRTLSPHLPLTGAAKMAANWNARGAWQDSFRLDFDAPWVFPWGTNHLTSVEVLSYGEIRPRWNDTNAVARLGAPVSIVPGLTHFGFEQTPSNSYRFVWTDATVGRVPRGATQYELMTAAIELMRNGDVAITTNGVSWTIPRELPFAHDGYGQDAEWVAANFTNATEIAAAGGYAAWVDAQVGEGLTNGLYRLTVGVADDPPETANLVVGDLSVAVTNAGEYVFLLEKGVEYDYGTVPFLTNVTSVAVDDVPRAQVSPRLLSAVAGGTGAWTVDGGYENREPTAEALGRVAWWPLFCGSPDVSHIGPDDGPVTFDAILSDYCGVSAVTYAWTASEGLTVVSPHAQSTAVRIEDMPSWAEAYLSVTATIGAKTLYSHTDRLTYGTNDTPQVHLSLNIPAAILLNGNEVSAAKIAVAGWAFSSDAPTSGVIQVSCVSGGAKVLASGLLGEWTVGDAVAAAATIEGIETSAAVGDVVFRAAFIGDDGVTNAVTRALTVVRTKDVLVPSAPDDGLVVLTNTPIALQLDCEPAGADGLLSTMWHVRRLKSDGTYGEWTLSDYAHLGASTVFTPIEGGIYEVRTLASVAAGGTDERFYVWDADENSSIGIRRKGDRKAIGVCDEQWQIDLRNCAKAYLGSTVYRESGDVPAQYGFSGIDSPNPKCNLFVAHRIVEAGMQCPVQHTGRLGMRAFPPLANDWQSDSVSIERWARVPATACPQPGFVASLPGQPHGHCGILDFDGLGVSAQNYHVTRRSKRLLTEGTYRKYTQENDNE